MTAPEPRRCVAPIDRISEDASDEEVASAFRTAYGREPDAEDYAAGLASLVWACPDALLCGCPATEERTVEGLVMPLCAEHARELDEERAADARELAAIVEEARAAGFTGHLPEGDLSEWCLELQAAGLERLADRVRETEAYRNS